MLLIEACYNCVSGRNQVVIFRDAAMSVEIHRSSVLFHTYSKGAFHKHGLSVRVVAVSVRRVLHWLQDGRVVYTLCDCDSCSKLSSILSLRSDSCSVA